MRTLAAEGHRANAVAVGADADPEDLQHWIAQLEAGRGVAGELVRVARGARGQDPGMRRRSSPGAARGIGAAVADRLERRPRRPARRHRPVRGRARRRRHQPGGPGADRRGRGRGLGARQQRRHHARRADREDDRGAVPRRHPRQPRRRLRAHARACTFADGASVVSLASRAYLGNFGQFNYSASKGGLVGMTRALALELAPRVRVNAIAPSLTASEMTQARCLPRCWTR